MRLLILGGRHRQERCDLPAAGASPLTRVDRVLVSLGVQRHPSKLLGHKHEAVHMPRLDRPEVPVVERRDRVGAVAFGERDDGGVDDAER